MMQHPKCTCAHGHTLWSFYFSLHKIVCHLSSVKESPKSLGFLYPFNRRNTNSENKVLSCRHYYSFSNWSSDSVMTFPFLLILSNALGCISLLEDGSDSARAPPHHHPPATNPFYFSLYSFILLKVSQDWFL